MIDSETPSEAWKILGTVLFEIKGKQYIILSDYYSKYPIVKQLQNPITSAAVTKVVEVMLHVWAPGSDKI